MPRITIVIPSYNSAHLLPTCVDSVQNQAFRDWEAVVVNDGSADGTATVAEALSSADGRIRVVNKPVNEGLHLARRTGVQNATGDYVMFLDADDELASGDVLGRLAAELDAEPCDVLRFGLLARAEQGVPESAARGFMEWSNADSNGFTAREAFVRTFSVAGEWRFPWHMTHRLFARDLLEHAFRIMSAERLERAEDAYEYFVVGSLADVELCCDVEGYLYHMGAGVTNARSLPVEAFLREAASMKACYEAAIRHAELLGDVELVDCAYGLRVKLLEGMGNDLNERVTEGREEAERALIDIVGNDAACCEFWRFVRDRAGALLVGDQMPDDSDDLFRMEALARETYRVIGDAAEKRRCDFIKRAAEDLLDDLASRRGRERAKRDIRIFASTHKQASSFESSIIDMVQVGAATAAARFWDTLHDDAGDNISHLNHTYCELTTQYWAWKNVEAEYYGFCHYRRYFDFSDVRHEENAWGEIIDGAIDAAAQRKYRLDDEGIRTAVAGCDVVVTERKDLRAFPEGAATPLDHWRLSANLREEDLVRMMAILIERHPDYEEDAYAYLGGHESCFCNMFIMRKRIFFEYCEWLFPLLEEFVGTTDMSTYSHEMQRVAGHLSERLLNIFLMHHERIGAGWKVSQVQCVHFTEPVAPLLAKPLSYIAASVHKPVVPIVLAADDAYVPMLATTLRSLLDNASPAAFYDITVLTTDISYANQKLMQADLPNRVNASLDFIDVWPLLSSYRLSTNNPHIGVETYYRFLIQDILPDYDKVIYLDSDLVIQGDVSELAAVELGDNLIAAVRDVDYLGNLNMGTERYEYTKRVLGMSDPYAYFQAGVLVLNTAALRSHVSVREWLERAQDTAYIYNDQDILNARCEGRVVYLDQSWNVMHDCYGRVGRIFANAPAEAYDAYCEAIGREKVIHYAGGQKPWNTIGCDREDVYWAYARKTPFYEHLLALLAIDGGAAVVEERRLRELDRPVVSEDHFIRRFADPLMPLGSRRRELARKLVQKARGI